MYIYIYIYCTTVSEKFKINIGKKKYETLNPKAFSDLCLVSGFDTGVCWGRFLEMFNQSYETYALQGLKRKAKVIESGPTMVM
jgi:hypothetical protein